MDTVKVLVADNNAMIGDGICSLLKEHESIDVAGPVTSSEDLFEMVREQVPDVVLMDIGICLIDGGEIIRCMRQERSGIKVLLMSEQENRDRILMGLKAGCNGYIPKRATSSDLVSAIVAVYRGGYFLYPSMAKTMVGEYLRIKRGLSPDPYDQLSDSERKVLQLLAEGYKNRQIAENLNTLLKAVIRHKVKIMSKLGIHNQNELIRYAIRKHLIEL